MPPPTIEIILHVLRRNDRHRLEAVAVHVCRPLCALCQGMPHPGMDCNAYKAGAGNVSDVAVHEMAKKAKWKQCPSCK